MLQLRHLAIHFGSRKLTRDIAYSLGSFAALAVSGVILNVAISGIRDAASLGVFNQSYAFYIMSSQLAVFGLHYSTLRHAALHESEPLECGRLLWTSATCALGMGFLGSVLVALSTPALSLAFDSAPVGRAIRNAAFGLALFPANKVLLAYLNALRRMKALALFQIGRVSTITLVVLAVCISHSPIESASLAFAAAEAVTVLAVVAFLVVKQLAPGPTFSLDWARRHLSFGARSLPAGLFAEANARLDVLMVGLLLQDRMAGIYSFAAMLSDGLYHVLATIRLNFNPLLVSALRDWDRDRCRDLLEKSRRFVPPFALSVSLAALGLFWLLARWIGEQKGLMEGLTSLLILLLAITAVSRFIPFDNLALVAGRPSYQTAQQAAGVATNVAVALLLLPLLGIAGAAIATSLSYLASVVILVAFARRQIGWNLLSNSFEG